MTLKKSKPRKVSIRSQKRVAEHHRKDKRYMQHYWPYLPMIAILLLGLVFNSWLNNVHRGVLGYATDMSVGSIIDDTNAQRGANGLGGLTGNSLLTQAAQNKANDMAARDYWSHNTPDGQTPWTFITATGYSYKTAGENLAYGFTTAAATLDGWMNSPGHRANILNTTFTEMGVGIVNIPNYQNSGPQTLVVAMYASPYSVAPAPAPAPAPTPTPTASVQSTKPAVTQPPVQAQETPLTTETPQTPIAEPTPAPTQETATGSHTSSQPGAKTEAKPQKIHRSQLLAAAPVAAWSAGATSILAIAAAIFLLIRHGFAWRRYLKRGEKFMLHHPLLDIAAIFVIVVATILAQTAGIIL
jgi:hypothetical protein